MVTKKRSNPIVKYYFWLHALVRLVRLPDAEHS